MGRSLRIACMLGIILAVLPAPPSHAAGDINIAWNECAQGSGSAGNLALACTGNTGSERLFVSFRPPANSDLFRATVGTILVTFDDTAVPSWWHFENGGCRFGHLGTVSDFTAGPFGCTDVWSNGATAASVFDIPGAPNVLRIRSVIALPPGAPVPVDTAHEYYAYELVINNAKTTGTGSCPGCGTAACLVLTQVELDYDDNSSVIVADGAQRFVTWQGGGSVPCPGATPARSRSWGMIKTLYR